MSISTQKIKNLIKQGEGISLEFKESQNELPVSFIETIGAFLNREGGRILLGVSDDKKLLAYQKQKRTSFASRLLIYQIIPKN
jgi:ATP-dependent DNA helicase RecG